MSFNQKELMIVYGLALASLSFDQIVKLREMVGTEKLSIISDLADSSMDESEPDEVALSVLSRFTDFIIEAKQ